MQHGGCRRSVRGKEIGDRDLVVGSDLLPAITRLHDVCTRERRHDTRARWWLALVGFRAARLTCNTERYRQDRDEHTRTNDPHRSPPEFGAWSANLQGYAVRSRARIPRAV